MPTRTFLTGLVIPRKRAVRRGANGIYSSNPPRFFTSTYNGPDYKNASDL